MFKQSDVMLTNYLEREKIIVKITKGNYPQYKIINRLLNNEINFVHTKCTFVCYEDNLILDSEYDNTTQYCNANKDKGDEITLELMTRYDSSLNKHQSRFYFEKYYTITIQLLLAQLVVFEKYGFVHNDITLSNILFKIHKSPIKFLYEINKLNVPIDDNELQVVISDFGKAMFIFFRGNFFR